MCIKNFKLVVHVGWYIDDNSNLVNTWSWEIKNVISEEKKLMAFSWIIWTCGVNRAKKFKKKKIWVSFTFDFEC